MDTNGNLSDEALVSAAYERVKDDLAAIKPEEFIQINLDIPTAVSTIIGVLPEVKALRPRIEKELPTFDLASFDKLEDYAWALSYAQSLVERRAALVYGFLPPHPANPPTKRPLVALMERGI